MFCLASQSNLHKRIVNFFTPFLLLGCAGALRASATTVTSCLTWLKADCIMPLWTSGWWWSSSSLWTGGTKNLLRSLRGVTVVVSSGMNVCGDVVIKFWCETVSLHKISSSGWFLQFLSLWWWFCEPSDCFLSLLLWSKLSWWVTVSLHNTSSSSCLLRSSFSLFCLLPFLIFLPVFDLLRPLTRIGCHNVQFKHNYYQSKSINFKCLPNKRNKTLITNRLLIKQWPIKSNLILSKTHK